jgi:hypothetical protein
MFDRVARVSGTVYGSLNHDRLLTYYVVVISLAGG